MLTLSSAVDAFRIANDISGSAIYDYQTVALTKDLVPSNDGILIKTPLSVEDRPSFDIIFIISSLASAEFRDVGLERWLQRQAREGAIIAPLGAATIFAARAGLLDGYRSATHWKYHETFPERFPRVPLSRGLYSIDRDRLTAAGGLAALDLGLAIVAHGLNSDLAKQVAEEVMHVRLRAPGEHQRMDVAQRYEVTDRRVVRAIDMMEAHLEPPARLSQIAAVAALSQRQLERLFSKCLGKSPLRVYLEIRLQLGRELVMHSTEPLPAIAARCGFADASHFSRHYHTAFGEPPSRTRKKAEAAARGRLVAAGKADVGKLPKSAANVQGSRRARR
jgi:transcriptional regulator GlxA family with amidase domain